MSIHIAALATAIPRAARARQENLKIPDHRVGRQFFLILLFIKRRYTRPDRDIHILVIRFRLDVFCMEKVGDGAAEGLDGDFVRYLDEDVFVPLTSVDKVAKREWYVGLEISSVLSEDDVSPMFD